MTPPPITPIEVKIIVILGVFFLGWFLGRRQADDLWMSNADDPISEKIECRGKLFRVRHAR